MKTLSIAISKPYDVIIGEHLITNLGEYALQVTKPGKAVLISDANVWPIYGTAVASSLAKAGFDILDYILPAGDQHKNGSTYLQLLGFLADNHIQKSDVIVSLGGGVVSDICSFLAATYLCGISYIQVPTTLSAMVDATVVTQSNIHLSAYRNLAGANYPPSLVLCDTKTLNSLPIPEFHNGCAEAIKFAILFDGKLFKHLVDHVDSFDREYVIGRCIELKLKQLTATANSDLLLNLGSTVCHAIEAIDDYTISHGKALSLGICAATRAAQQMGIADKAATDSIIETLSAFSLPTASAHTVEDVYDSAISSIRFTNDDINLILPKKIGRCIVHRTDSEGLRFFIENGL